MSGYFGDSIKKQGASEHQVWAFEKVVQREPDKNAPHNRNAAAPL
jgi:hypothetical protein